jgi:hypothetical protein
VVDDAVELGAAGSALGVGDVEAELDGLAEGACSGVEPVGLAPGRTKQFDDRGFRAVHKHIAAQMFQSVKSNDSASSPQIDQGASAPQDLVR